MKPYVITIARQYGSGGKTVGKMLAEKLQIPCYNREIITMASEDSGVNALLFSDERLKSDFADPLRDRTYIENEDAAILFFCVRSYDEGEQYARALAAIGCDTIELCPGFGNEGVGRIQKAVGPYVPVGVVRFDIFPPCGADRSPDWFQMR